MLKRPDLSDKTIITSLYNNYDLSLVQMLFQPIGDTRNAIYYVTDDNGATYFLKLCPPNFNEAAVTIPAYLHAQGVQQIIAPIPTATQALWVAGHGFTWILYPLFQGKNGFERALSKTQWNRLGAGLRNIHQMSLPAELIKYVPKETYSPRWRDIVRALDKEVRQKQHDDPIATDFAALWMSKRNEIQALVQRAEKLAQALENRPLQKVVCHSDLHAGNVMIGSDGPIVIVDWDEPILAPKERDLMFIGGGIGGIWNDESEVEWFYEGYGQAEIDLVALVYYRYERIVVDIVEYAQQIFGMWGGVEDRQKGLRLIEQFGPNNVVEIAHRSYQQLCFG